VLFNLGENWTASQCLAADERRSSELAQLLKYDGNLGFNEQLQRIVSYFDTKESSASSSSVSEEDVQNTIYTNALLNRNQFGNYLDFVEQEQTYQKSVETLEETLDDTRESIRSAFESFNLEELNDMLEGDFDLADDETYDNLLDKLESYKNELMEYIGQELAKVTAENEVVKEEYDRQKNAVKLLTMDSEEILSLSTTMTADETFTAKLKEERASRAVTDRYADEAKEAFEKQLKSFESPYCAAY
jgi:hypothetical protein